MNIHPSGGLIKFITLNVRGLNDSVKRNQFFKELKTMKYDVVFLQESYCQRHETLFSWAEELGAIAVASLSPLPSCRGTVVFINNQLDFQVEDHHLLDDDCSNYRIGCMPC